MHSEEKIYIGFIVYNDLTAKYLPDFLSSLFSQTYKNFRVIIFDNSTEVDNENYRYLKSNYSNIDILREKGNIGFARAYNILINRVISEGANYFLALNPDVILEKDFIARALESIRENKKNGVIVPKILSWDFKNKKKTNIIDSCGLELKNNLSFFERGRGEENEVYNQREDVFGFTGAVVFFRITALQDVAFLNKDGKSEYFDELMFMYKEDCDLSFRLWLANWKIVFEPKLIAYHDRTIVSQGESIWRVAKNRLRKKRQIKQWSFLHQWIIFSKYRKLPFGFLRRVKIFWYKFISLSFVVFFEPYLLLEFRNLYKLRGKIKRRRQALKIRLNDKEINNI